MHLVGSTQQIYIDLKTSAPRAASGIPQVKIRLQKGLGHRLVILGDHAIELRLGGLPFPIEVGLFPKLGEQRDELFQGVGSGRSAIGGVTPFEGRRAVHAQREADVLAQLVFGVWLAVGREKLLQVANRFKVASRDGLAQFHPQGVVRRRI